MPLVCWKLHLSVLLGAERCAGASSFGPHIQYALPGGASTVPPMYRLKVSNQSDGAELVLSLESKNGGRLEDARQLLLRRLPQRALLGEQRDVDELSSPLGQDGQVGGPFAP